MNAPEHPSTLLQVARVTLAFVHVAVWIGLFLAVFFGLYTIPTLMMAVFLLAYVVTYYVRHRRASR